MHNLTVQPSTITLFCFHSDLIALFLNSGDNHQGQIISHPRNITSFHERVFQTVSSAPLTPLYQAITLGHAICILIPRHLSTLPVASAATQCRPPHSSCTQRQQSTSQNLCIHTHFLLIHSLCPNFTKIFSKHKSVHVCPGLKIFKGVYKRFQLLLNSCYLEV